MLGGPPDALNLHPLSGHTVCQPEAANAGTLSSVCPPLCHLCAPVCPPVCPPNSMPDQCRANCVPGAFLNDVPRKPTKTNVAHDSELNAGQCRGPRLSGHTGARKRHRRRPKVVCAGLVVPTMGECAWRTPRSKMHKSFKNILVGYFSSSVCQISWSPPKSAPGAT